MGGMSQNDKNELLIEMFEAPVIGADYGHYYDPPEGFVKPTSYPGLGGGKSMAAMNVGYVDLGLVNPYGEGPKDKKLRSTILRYVVKLLIASKGKSVFIRDPEWALKEVYPGQKVKTVLKEKVEEALEAMFGVDMLVVVSGFKGKTGFGWRFKCTDLAKHPKVVA